MPIRRFIAGSYTFCEEPAVKAPRCEMDYRQERQVHPSGISPVLSGNTSTDILRHLWILLNPHVKCEL
jgi:hypothetical protein